jgi:uncharacterized metal-binding protein YceD (DUF177 family)
LKKINSLNNVLNNKKEENVKIRIHGIQDGKHQIELKENVKNIPYFFPEFIDEVRVSGFLTKSKNRFNFVGTAKCDAKLICDISSEEFVEEISADIHINFVADTTLFYIQKNSSKENEEIVVHEDDEYFDISTEVKDVLAVSIPMKRISPKYRGKTFAEIYPQFSNKIENKNKEIADERWAALKNINLN